MVDLSQHSRSSVRCFELHWGFNRVVGVVELVICSVD